MEHFHYLSIEIGENRAAKLMRGLLLSYTKGLPHCRHFRSSFTSINDIDTLVSALDEYFAALEAHSSLEDTGT
jgi:tRNA-dihydrouridine synthase